VALKAILEGVLQEESDLRLLWAQLKAGDPQLVTVDLNAGGPTKAGVLLEEEARACPGKRAALGEVPSRLLELPTPPTARGVSSTNNNNASNAAPRNTSHALQPRPQSNSAQPMTTAPTATNMNYALPQQVHARTHYSTPMAYSYGSVPNSPYQPSQPQRRVVRNFDADLVDFYTSTSGFAR
jgi:hypothetical protein